MQERNHTYWDQRFEHMFGVSNLKSETTHTPEVKPASVEPPPSINVQRARESLRTLLRGGAWTTDTVRRSLRLRSTREVDEILREENPSLLTEKVANAIERMLYEDVVPGTPMLQVRRRISHHPKNKDMESSQNNANPALKADFREIVRMLTQRGWTRDQVARWIGLKGGKQLSIVAAPSGTLPLVRYNEARRLLNEDVPPPDSDQEVTPQVPTSLRQAASAASSSKERKPNKGSSPKRKSARRKSSSRSKPASPAEHEAARRILTLLSEAGLKREEIALAIGYTSTNSISTALGRGKLPKPKFKALVAFARQHGVDPNSAQSPQPVNSAPPAPPISRETASKPVAPAATPAPSVNPDVTTTAEPITLPAVQVQHMGSVTRFSLGDIDLNGIHNGDDYLAAAVQAMRVGLQIIDKALEEGKFKKLLAMGVQSSASELREQVEALEEWVEV